MGEARKDALKLDFDRRLKLEFHGTKVTSDAERLCVGPAMRHAARGIQVSGAAVCQNSGKKWVLHANTSLFWYLMRCGVLKLSESCWHRDVVMVLSSLNFIEVSQEKYENVQKCRL